MAAPGRRGWLLGLSLLIAWQVITRPLTAIAFTIPVAVVVLVTTFRNGRWGDLALAVVIGVACLSVLPYQNHVTTGNWRVRRSRCTARCTSRSTFRASDSTRLRRREPLPADFQAFAARFARCTGSSPRARLPFILVERIALVLLDAWGRLVAVVRGARPPGPGRRRGGSLFGAGTCLFLMICYLTFAHDQHG